MAKRCPGCGQVNDDSRIFCSACGKPLNSDLRLIQDLEKHTKPAPSSSAPASRRNDDDDDYVPPRTERKKASPLPWIILGLAAAAVVLAWILLA